MTDGSTTEVAFFGKITASVTHELNNVLSIIEQSAGLLDDLVAGEERGVPLSVDRLKGVSGSVQKQAQRGLDIVARLNRFAHTTDRSQTVFDVNEVTGNLVDLCRRFAQLKKLDLEFRPATEALVAKGSPFVLQQAVFLALQSALEAASAGSKIVIENCAAPAGAVCISYFGAGEPERAAQVALNALAGQFNGQATVEAAEGRILVRLVLACES